MIRSDPVTAQLVEMTPGQASDLLCSHTPDRRPDWTVVFSLAGKMLLGWWVPGLGNPIEVDTASGRLVNGQHRLIAIVLAGRPVEVELIEVTQ